MAQTKVNAPEGYHFMVKTDGSFYLMKNPEDGYKAHTLTNGDKASEYVMMTYKTKHPAPMVSSRTARPTRTAGPSVRTTNRTVTNTGSRVARRTTTTTSSGGSGGGYSGGSSGGGY
tara:strand:+ start:1810 stop:2157 length:348 start_codon:yes stop_codon:yes gene_type:complete